MDKDGTWNYKQHQGRFSITKKNFKARERKGTRKISIFARSIMKKELTEFRYSRLSEDCLRSIFVEITAHAHFSQSTSTLSNIKNITKQDS